MTEATNTLAKAKPCIVCHKHLESVDPLGGGNQPSGGTAFTSHGHYGSGVFDSMDGTFLEVDICDDCLRAAARESLVLRAYPAPQRNIHRYEDFKVRS